MALNYFDVHVACLVIQVIQDLYRGQVKGFLVCHSLQARAKSPECTPQLTVCTDLPTAFFAFLEMSANRDQLRRRQGSPPVTFRVAFSQVTRHNYVAAPGA